MGGGGHKGLSSEGRLRVERGCSPGVALSRWASVDGRVQLSRMDGSLRKLWIQDRRQLCICLGVLAVVRAYLAKYKIKYQLLFEQPCETCEHL